MPIFVSILQTPFLMTKLAAKSSNGMWNLKTKIIALLVRFWSRFWILKGPKAQHWSVVHRPQRCEGEIGTKLVSNRGWIIWRWRREEDVRPVWKGAVMLGNTLKPKLGPYRYMPAFFLLGAGIEFFMIKVRVGKETFCKYGTKSCR